MMMSNKSFQSSPPSSKVQLFYPSSLSPPTTPAKGSRGILDDRTKPVPIFFPRPMRESETTHHMQIKMKENIRQQSNSLLRSKSIPCMQIKPRHVDMTAGTTSTTHSRSSIKIEDILPPPFSLPSESSTSSSTGGIIDNMPAYPSLLATKSESFKLPKRSSMHFKPKRRASLTSRAA